MREILDVESNSNTVEVRWAVPRDHEKTLQGRYRREVMMHIAWFRLLSNRASLLTHTSITFTHRRDSDVRFYQSDRHQKHKEIPKARDHTSDKNCRSWSCVIIQKAGRNPNVESKITEWR